MNRLFFGDSLAWLRDTREFHDAAVDLVYLDPPFNSNADYNVLFREESGEASQAQFHAFADTWTWADAADTYNHFTDAYPNLAAVEMMQALHSFLKNSPVMAYLAMAAHPLLLPQWLNENISSSSISTFWRSLKNFPNCAKSGRAVLRPFVRGPAGRYA